jgi:cell division GTPase FtsZ
MKRREFFKASGGIAGLFAGVGNALVPAADTGRESMIFDATGTETLTGPPCDIRVFGLGGFGSRMVSRLAFEVRPLLDEMHSESSFFALDTDEGSLPSGELPLVRSVLVEDADSVLLSAVGCSASSLVLLMAGMGGATGMTLIQETAKRARRTGALTVAVVSMPVDDPLRNAEIAKELVQIKEVSDVVFAIAQTGHPLIWDAIPLIQERARSLLNAERWMLRCVAGLLRAVALPARTTLGVAEIRSLLASAKGAGYGVAEGRGGQELGSIGEAAIKQALACGSGEIGQKLRAALIVISGPAAQLRWSSVEPGKNELRRLLGPETSCLFGVQPNNHRGCSSVKTEVWLAFS